jgi:ATP-dependent exoDNAse (exonuclease V) alpha subunit
MRMTRHSDYCDERGRPQLIHAYASTTCAAQGLTVEETFVLHDAQMDRAAAYVVDSRHRDRCEWFCNSKGLDELHPAIDDGERLQHLANMLSTDRYQALAMEHWGRLLKEPEPTREHHHELEPA